MKHINADRLTAFVKARRDLHYKYFVKNGVGCIAEYKYDEDVELLDFITSLQQEQPKQKKKCNNCPHCVDRKDQNGWHFKGCFGGPYKGKFIAEIDECPLPEQPEVDLEEEIKNYLATECAADDEPSVSEIARHFYELGLNARKV